MTKIANIIEPIKLLKGSHDHTASTGQGCFMNVIAYLNGEPQITDKSECVCFVVRPIAIWFNDFLQDSERHILIPFIERAMGSRTSDRAEIERRALLAADMAQRMSDATAKYSAEAAAWAAGAAAGAAEAAWAAWAAWAAGAARAAWAAEAAESARDAARAAESARAAARAAEAAEAAAWAAGAAAGAAEAAAWAAEAAAEAAESAWAAARAAEAARAAAWAAGAAAIREEIKSACLEFLDRALPQKEQGQVVIERAKRLRELVTV